MLHHGSREPAGEPQICPPDSPPAHGSPCCQGWPPPIRWMQAADYHIASGEESSRNAWPSVFFGWMPHVSLRPATSPSCNSFKTKPRRFLSDPPVVAGC
jgi:hypothetical protein